MATAGSKAAKPVVDHSAVSGAPPKEADAVAMPNTAAGPTRLSERSKVPADGGMLSLIESGRTVAPPRILIYGTEGVGKSTLASKAENAVFVQTEDGLKTIDCKRFPLSRTYRDVVEKLTFLADEEHPFGTVVLDSVDWLEKLIWANVCARNGKQNIEDIGYAKGYKFALDEWREIVSTLDRCMNRGIAVILIAHAKVEKFEDPENPTFDRYTPRLDKHAMAFINEWCDAVLFATRKLAIKKEDLGFNKERAIAIPVGAGGGERILRCVGSAACLAKNRYDMPAEIPLSWDAIVAALAKFMTP
jgi:hypothetical protein